MTKKHKKAFIIITILIMFLFVEITVRFAYYIKNTFFSKQTNTKKVNTTQKKDTKKKDTISTKKLPPILGLDPYEERDQKIPWLWRLKPNYRSKYTAVIESKKKLGRILSVEYLEKQKKYITHQEIIFKVNKHGFKGPEIDQQHSKIRIITLGDSCTFGMSFVDEFCYPRAMEIALKKMGGNVEVINAGVEGYGTQHILARIDEFKALQPEIVTLYVGWNNLYNPSQYPLTETKEKEEKYKPGFMFKYIYTYRLCVRLYQRYIKSKATSLEKYKKNKVPKKKGWLIKKLNGYQMPFLNEIEKIIKHFQGKAKIVLITLPGLFTMDHPISKRASKIGHLPAFTSNPYVLAKATEEYNKSLRSLAKRYQIPLVDLEKWSKKILKSRDQYFIDSVHLNNKGEQMVGVYMAKRLFALLPKKVRKH